MKSASPHLLFFAMAGPLAAQEPTAPVPAKTSARVGQEIRAALPRYTPPPPPVLDQPKEPAADPDVFALPTFTVKEKRPRTHDPDVWLTDRAVQQKAMVAYRQSMSELEWALNSWFIPLLSPPPSARARAAYDANKSLADLQRVHRLFTVISATDSRAAAELEQERIKMDQSVYWQSRPAGDGRKK